MNKKAYLLFISLIFLNRASYADTLADIYELALKNDPQLRAAQAVYKAGKEQYIQERASLLPHLAISWVLRRSENENKNRLAGNSIEETIEDSRNIGLELNQSVFRLGRWFSLRQGKALSKQAKAELSAAQQALIVRVAETYFNVLTVMENLSSAAAEEVGIKHQLDQAQQRFDVGLIPMTDVHESKARYDIARANRLAEENQLGVAMEALTLITGRRHQDIAILDEGFFVTHTIPSALKPWVGQAIKGNFDLKAKAYARDAAKQNANAKKSEHFPTVDLVASYGHRYGRTRNDIDHAIAEADDQDRVITLNFNMPLFTGGRISSARREAYQQYMASKEHYIFARRDVDRKVRSLHLTVNTDVSKVNAQKQAVASTQSALDATQAGYEVGTRDVIDVLNAQQNVYDATREYAAARHSYMVNMLKLKELTGSLTPEDIYRIDKYLVAK